MRRTTRFLLAVLLPWLVVAQADAVRKLYVPECPIAGHASCSDRSDNDGDGLIDEAAPAAAFAPCTGGFCAEFETNTTTSGAIVSVADAAFSEGDYLHLPLGNPFGSGQVALCGDFAAGTYYLHIRAAVPSSARPWVWVSLDAPLGVTLDNTIAALLANGQARPAPGWDYSSTTDSITNFLTKLVGTAQKTFALDGEHCFYVAPDPEIQLDAAYLTEDINQQPQLGGGGQTVVQYEIFEIGANSISVDGSCADTAWGQANVVPWNGYTESANVPTLKLLWDNAGTDLLYGCLSVTDTDLRATTTTNDNSNIFGDDGLEMMDADDQTAALDATRFKTVLNIAATPAHLDRNYPSGVASDAYTRNITKAVSRNGDLDSTADDTSYVIEWVMDLGHDAALGQLVKMQFRINDADAAGSVRDAFGTLDNLDDVTQWGIVKLSSTTVPAPPPDTTAPTVGAVSISGLGNTGATATFTSNEAGTCAVRYDTDNDNAVSGGDMVTGAVQGVVSGGQCVYVLSGLVSNTAYEIVGVVVDGAGNTGVSSSVTDFTTTGGSGAQFYVSTSGSGSTCSSGSPCAVSRLFAGSEPRPSPGETWLVRNGTYSGPWNFNCAGGQANGTASQPITVKAENERQAFIQGTGDVPLRVDNCSYWVFDGLRVESIDAAGRYPNSVVWFQSSSNLTLKRGLYRKPNRMGGDGSTVQLFFTTNSLLEENEVYESHRHGIILSGDSNNNTLRRNFVHTRAYPDAPGGIATNASGGDGCIQAYPGRNGLIENNICLEGDEGLSALAPTSSGAGDNRWFGNMSADSNVVFTFGSQYESVYLVENDVVRDHVAIRGGWGYTSGGVNTSFVNISGFDGNGFGLIVERKLSGQPIPAGMSTTCTNCAMVNNAQHGFNMIDGAWALNYTNAFSNNPDYSHALSDSRITNEVTGNPNFGTCRVWVPTGSPLKTAGLGGTYIGGEVIYRYIDGVKTTQKLWTPSAPSGYSGTSYPFYFSGCGAVISGVNSDPANSCAGIGSPAFFNVVSACLPVGY